ncbi:O-antigen ligase family protein [Arhodomonas sp. AD133]|uniref:O-antigen ligase family protein n=1 Tax=Arhodomonas sp. AD133 TaxID=3415009 RepID=UPI003EB6AF31
MIKQIILVCFLVTLMADDMLDMGLGIATGLSAKNAYLYLIILLILFEKAIVKERGLLQLPVVHAIFVLLIGDASLSILSVHLLADYGGYDLFGKIVSLKGVLVDPYFVFLVFFYGVFSGRDAVRVARWLVGFIVVINFVTLLDVYDMPDLGLIEFRKGRLSGPLGQPNEYGAFLVFFIPLMFSMALSSRHMSGRVFFALGTIVSFGFLIQTVSRSSYTALMTGTLFAIWWLRDGIDVKRVMRWGGALILVGVAVAALFAQQVVLQFEERILWSTIHGDADQITSGRTWLWATALDFQMAKPWTLLFGVGWDSFTDFHDFSAHNAYINYLFSLGAVGLSLFVALIVTMLRYGKKGFFAARSLEERVMLAGFVAAWFGMAVVMMGGTFNKPWLFIWAYSGLCMRIVYEAARERMGEQNAGCIDSVPGMSRP